MALGGRDLPLWADRLIVLIPAALLSSLVVVQTFADGQELVLDARAPALGASAIALWLKAPLVVCSRAARRPALRALGLGPRARARRRIRCASRP